MAQEEVITQPTHTEETIKILVEGVSLSIAYIFINVSKLRATEGAIGGFAGKLEVPRGTPYPTV